MATSTSQNTPNPRAYLVQNVDNLGVGKYLIHQEKRGPLLLPHLCNTLILQNKVELKDEDVHGSTVSELRLYHKMASCADAPNWHEQDKLQRLIEAFGLVGSKLLNPTFDKVDGFKQTESESTPLIAQFLGVKTFHGHVLNPEDVKAKKIIDDRYFSEMKNAVRNKKSRLRAKGKNLEDDWITVDQLINSHNPYSVTCLKQKMNEVLVNNMKDPVCLFYWQHQFSTIKLHDGDLYVLDAAESCRVNKVMWQRLTVITAPKDASNTVFFDSEFREVVLHSKDDGEPSHTRTMDADAENTQFVQILDQYGSDFIAKDLASAVVNSIKKNTRLVADLDWTLVSTQMPKIISDHSDVYSTCVQSLMDTTEESSETKAAAIRDVKDSILHLALAFLRKAEVSEKLEEDFIGPFMNIVLTDYLESEHNKMPSIFKSFSLNIVEKCEKIDKIFNVAFAPRQMETAKHLYLFTLLARISRCHFELLTKLPFQYKLVLENFCEQLKENNTLIFDNLDPIVELLGNFENNIKGENLVGSDLNETMSIIFGSIVSLYRSVYAGNEPLSTSEEKRSFGSAIYKLVEVFLEKTERLEGLEKDFIIPLMKDALNGYVKTGAEIPLEFVSLSKMFVKKCSEACIIIETLSNCSRERSTYEEQYDYIFSFLEEACEHCSQFVNQLPLPQSKYVMEFISWAMMDTKYSIGKTGAKLLIRILKTFEAPDVPVTSFKEHILAIMNDIMTILSRFPEPEMEALCFNLLKQLFNVIDDLSEPLWDDKKVPTHYNCLFAREQAAQFLESKCQTLEYSKAAEFIDGVFLATNDSSHFLESASNLLLQLKKLPQISEFDSASTSTSTSNETRQSSSNSATVNLFDETCEKRCEEKLKDFLRMYTEKDCHSPYYEGMVVAMYWTGLNKLEINFKHIISFDHSFATDFLLIYSRFRRKIKAVVTDFMFHVKNKLDKELGNSSHLKINGEISVVVNDMPASIEGFREFTKIPGNGILRDQIIFDSVAVEEKTDLGRLALCSYVQDMCETHARGDSWDGNFSLDDFKVFNKTEFRICKKPFASCSHSTESNDFSKFATELLPLYRNSAYVKVLSSQMKLYIVKGDYTPKAARHFRFRMITHIAGKSPVLISLIFLDLWRGYRLLCKTAKSLMMKILCRRLSLWQTKVKGNPILLSLYNYKNIDQKIMDKLKMLIQKNSTVGQGDSDDEDEPIDSQLDAMVAATDLRDQLKKLVRGENLDTNVSEEETKGANESVDAGSEAADVKKLLVVDNIQHGDKVYDDTLVSMVRYIRHGVVHLGDPNNVGKNIVIKRLIELQMLLSNVLEEEMAHVIGDLVLNSRLFTEEILDMLEESWKIYARPESNRPCTEPLGLRDLKSA